MPLSLGKCQSELQLIQKETIFFSGYGAKSQIPMLKFQIISKTENQIPKHTDQIFSVRVSDETHLQRLCLRASPAEPVCDLHHQESGHLGAADEDRELGGDCCD